MVNAATIQTEADLADLLTRCRLPFGPPNTSHAWETWRNEWRGQPPIARASGELFLAVCNAGFELYILDPQDFWFQCIGRLRGEVTEQALVDMVEDVTKRFDWDRLMRNCRRIKFEDVWMAMLKPCSHPEHVSNTLKERLWALGETFVRSSTVAQVTTALEQLLRLLADPHNLTQVNYCILHNYLIWKQRYWGWEFLPIEHRAILDALVELFSSATEPTKDTVTLSNALVELLKRTDNLTAA